MSYSAACRAASLCPDSITRLSASPLRWSRAAVDVGRPLHRREATGAESAGRGVEGTGRTAGRGTIQADGLVQVVPVPGPLESQPQGDGQAREPVRMVRVGRVSGLNRSRRVCRGPARRAGIPSLDRRTHRSDGSLRRGNLAAALCAWTRPPRRTACSAADPGQDRFAWHIPRRRSAHDHDVSSCGCHSSDRGEHAPRHPAAWALSITPIWPPEHVAVFPRWIAGGSLPSAK